MPYKARFRRAINLNKFVFAAILSLSLSACSETIESPAPDNVIIRPAKPLVRKPGKLPEEATKSGYCLMQFDIDENGSPFNVKAFLCTHRIFESESVAAVSNFQYAPRTENGIAVIERKQEVKVTYVYRDKDGNIIPE